MKWLICWWRGHAWRRLTYRCDTYRYGLRMRDLCMRCGTQTIVEDTYAHLTDAERVAMETTDMGKLRYRGYEEERKL